MKQRLVVVPRARVDHKRDPFLAIVAILFVCMAWGLIAGWVYSTAVPR